MLADSPNGYWRLDEQSGSFADSSGHSLTGTATGTITYQTAGPLTDLNKAATFDGSTGYFTAADGAQTDLGDVFTLEAWVKLASTGATTKTVMSKGTNAYSFSLTATTGKLQLQKEGVATIVQSTTGITDTTLWHHVVVTKNGATVKQYLDGVDVTGTVTNATMADNATSLYVGQNSGTANFFPGGMDEVAIYPTALSAARVAAHYAAAFFGGTFVSLPGNLPEVSLTWSPTTAPNAAPVYTDLTSGTSLLARTVTINRGRVDEFSQFETATLRATIDNRDRSLDPNYTSGRFYPNVKPMRKIRFISRWPKGAGGSVYSRFVGFTGDEFAQQYNGVDAVVPLTAYDGFGVLAMAKLSSTFTRPAELSGARVTAVLDAVGWPAGDRVIATGAATLGAYSAATGVSALQHLQDVQDAEGGQMFVDRSGIFVLQDRHYRNVSTRTSRQTFATVAAAETGLHYSDVDIRWGGRLWNGAQITPSSSTVQEWNDTTSQSDYYPRVYTKSLPLSSDADALALAQNVVSFNKAPTLRCYSMTLAGAYDPTALWPVLLDLEVSHHVTVRVTPPAATGTYSFEQSIEGCEDTITASSWTMKFPMTPLDLGVYWTLGVSTLGVDTTLAY